MPGEIACSLIDIRHGLRLETAGILFHPICHAADESSDLWSIGFELVGRSSCRPGDVSYRPRPSDDLLVQSVLYL